MSVEVHFYRETGITRQLSKSQALKVYSLKTPGIEGSGNGARNFLIEGEWRGARGPKFLPRAARQPAALPDHIPGPGTACLCAHPRPSIFTRRLKFDFYQKSSKVGGKTVPGGQNYPVFRNEGAHGDVMEVRGPSSGETISGWFSSRRREIVE